MTHAPGSLESGRSKDCGVKWDYGSTAAGSSAAVAEIDLADRYGLFICGRFVKPRSRKYLPSTNPATGEAICEIAAPGARDMDAVVEAAVAGRKRWARIKSAQRARLHRSIARGIEERADELAATLTVDGGRPIRLTRVEVSEAAACFLYYAGWCDKLDHAFSGAAAKPIGVCGQALSWERPLLDAALALAPALACGNACILRPAPTASLAVLKLGEIVEECDLTPGVVNIITGEESVVNRLADNLIVQDITVSKPGSGNAIRVIFQDASIDQAIEGVVTDVFLDGGGSRVFIEEAILDEVIAKLKHRMSKLRVGDPLDPNTDIGPLHSEAQLTAFDDYVHTGVQGGSHLHQPECDLLLNEGYWRRPCLFTNAHPEQRIARESVTGPVMTVMSFRTPDEAISIINSAPGVNAAGIWTDKGAKMFEIARRLDAEMIWCNTPRVFDPTSSPAGISALRDYVRL